MSLIHFLAVLAQERPFQRFQDSGNDLLGALRMPWWPIIVFFTIAAAVILTKAFAKVAMLVLMLGFASVFIYNPDTLQSVGHIIIP